MPEMVAPRALVFRPLVKGNVDSGNEIYFPAKRCESVSCVFPYFHAIFVCFQQQLDLQRLDTKVGTHDGTNPCG